MQTISNKRPPFPGAGSKANDARPLTLAERLLTANEVAGILHISRSMVYHLVFRGDLPSLKIGSARRFRRHDLQRYLARHSGPIRRRA
jgi:excisionase family DNA binding protein